MNYETACAEIQHMFRYSYRDKWAPDHVFDGKSRIWVKAFNDLIKQGLIVRRKKYPGYEYKWNSVFPEGY